MSINCGSFCSTLALWLMVYANVYAICTQCQILFMQLHSRFLNVCNPLTPMYILNKVGAKAPMNLTINLFFNQSISKLELLFSHSWSTNIM